MSLATLSLPLRIYIVGNRLLGLSNLHYDPKTGRFLLYYLPNLLYCLLVNGICLGLLPFAVGFLVQANYNCQGLDMLGTTFNFVALSKMWSFILLLYNIWLRRRKIQELSNGLLTLFTHYQPYQADSSKKSMQKRYYFVIAIFARRLTVMGMELFHQFHETECTEQKSSLIYISASVFLLFLELMISYVDFTIYLTTAMGISLLEGMSHDIQQLKMDARQLQGTRYSHHDVLEQQLLSAWQKVWQHSMLLDKALKLQINSFQWQLLINLFSLYLSTLSIMFRMEMYDQLEEVYSDYIYLLYLTLSCGAVIEICTYFSIFTSIRGHWLIFRERIKEFWLSLQHLDLNMDGAALTIQLEFGLIQLGRNFQASPQRIRRLQIAGFFDMNMETAKAMVGSIIVNMFILYQMAMKKYW